MGSGLVVTQNLGPQIAAMLKADSILAEEFKAAMTQAALVAAGGVKEISPIDTGRLRSSIGGEIVRAIGLDIEAVIGTNVTHKGFPYPKALEESARYHYRAGPRQGQPTAGYFDKGIKAQQDVIFSLFDKAADRATARILEGAK